MKRRSFPLFPSNSEIPVIRAMVFLLLSSVPVFSAEPFPVLESVHSFDAGGLGCGEVSGMTRGLDGSVYVSGIGTTGNCVGTYASFVAKLTPSGTHAWTAVFSDEGKDNMTWGNPAIDSQGNVYLPITEICCPSGTGLIAQFDSNGSLIQAGQMPEADPSQAPFVTGVEYDPAIDTIYASQDTFNLTTENINPVVAAFTTNLSLLTHKKYEKPYWASSEAGLGLDNGGNMYIGGFEVPGIPTSDRYLGVQWSPQLASQNWSATQDATFTPGHRVNGAAFSTGGLALTGFEDDNGSDIYRFRRVSGNGSFETSMPISLEAFAPKVGTDENDNAYVLGTSVDNFLAAMVKVKSDGTFAWNPPALEETAIYSFDTVHVSSDNKIYTAGYLNEVIGDDEYYVATYQPANPVARLTISVGLSSLPPARPGSKANVVVTAYDAQNHTVPNVSILFSTTAVSFSGGHDHDNGQRPAGKIQGSGMTNQNGVLIASYTASAFGGYEKITASVAGSPQISTMTQVEVRVPSLTLLPSTTFFIMDGGTCLHHGPTAPNQCVLPNQNHYGTPYTIMASTTIGALWVVNHSTYPLEFNDISLPFGGGFDIGGGWLKDITPIGPNPVSCNPGHCTHRLGTNVDIQVFPNRSPNLLPEPERRTLRLLINAFEVISISTESTHWHIAFRR